MPGASGLMNGSVTVGGRKFWRNRKVIGGRPRQAVAQRAGLCCPTAAAFALEDSKDSRTLPQKRVIAERNQV